jgi:hypothetical protein
VPAQTVVAFEQVMFTGGVEGCVIEAGTSRASTRVWVGMVLPALQTFRERA